MSGHEKFYIPHDDLQELKTAIEALETDIETLNTNIVTLSTCFLQPRTETQVTGDGTLDAGFETLDIIDQVFSATVDVYLMCARVVLISDEDVFKLYDTDIDIKTYHDSTIITTERFCNGIHPMLPVNVGETIWAGNRMFDLRGTRVPAGETVKAEAGGYKTPADVGVSMWIFYREEVVL